MSYYSDADNRSRTDHRHCKARRRASRYTNDPPPDPSNNFSQMSSYHNRRSSFSCPSTDDDEIHERYDDPYCEECRSKRLDYRKRDQDSSGSNIIAIITALLGFGLTGGLGGIGIQFAAATLRAATMTAYVSATGAAAVGTGYVAIQGGRLVIQQAKPGIIMTVRAANRVTRDCRTGTLVAGQVVVDAVGAAQSGVASQVQTAGNAVTHISGRVSRSSEALMARLFNLPIQFTNVLLRSAPPGQQPLVVSLLSEAEALAHLQGEDDPNVETFTIQDLDDGTLGIQRIVRNGDLGDASWAISPDNQSPNSQSLNQCLGNQSPDDLSPNIRSANQPANNQSSENQFQGNLSLGNQSPGNQSPDDQPPNQSPNNQPLDSQPPENQSPDRPSPNDQTILGYGEDEDGFIQILARTTFVSSEDDVSTSDQFSFVTAQETAPTCVNDSENDYEIV